MSKDAPANPAQRELSEDEVHLAYQLFLNRRASPREMKENLERGARLPRLRRMFLSSKEFAIKLETFLPAHNVQITPKNKENDTRHYLHLHIPKTAGTTLSTIIGVTVGPDQCLTVSETADGPIGKSTPSDLAKHRFVFGHLTYRAAAYMPADTIILCVLRRPGARLYSFYRYIQRTKDHPLHKDVTSQNMSFGAFLEFTASNPAYRRGVDNTQMRIISGMNGAADLGREPDVFATAIAHLATGRILFGLTERFDSFQTYLRDQGIIRRVSEARLNAADVPQTDETYLDDLTDAQREIFDQYIAWDQMLYDICDKIDRTRTLSQTES